MRRASRNDVPDLARRSAYASFGRATEVAHDLERLTERLRAVPGRLLAHPESVIMQRPRIGVTITLRRVGRFEALRVAKAQRYPSSPMTSGDARAAQALPGSAFAARASAALA